MRDTYLLGTALGVDFNDYVGLRAFYYQSTEDEKISFDFDKMAMYGADFIAKLNVSRGIVPYLTVGGGYMNVYGSYVGVDENPFVPTNSSYFAKGGIGLTIPVSRYLEFFGAANLLYTTEKDPEDLESTEDLKKHTMFNAGLKFNMGRSARVSRALDSYVDQRVVDKAMMYEQRIAELKRELDTAYELNEIRKAAEIINEKQRLEAELAASINASKAVSVPVPPTVYVAADDSATIATDGLASRVEDQTMIRLTPQELESLVDRVVQGVGAPVLKKETPEERLDRLERLILSGGAPRVAQQPAMRIQQAEEKQPEESSTAQRIDDSNRQLIEEMQRISAKIEENSRRIDARIEENSRRIDSYTQQPYGGSDRTFIVSPGGQTQRPYPAAPQVRGGAPGSVGAAYDGQEGIAKSWVIYKGLSPFLGMNFGEKSSFLFGIKGDYGFSNSRFVFVPDLYFGIGSKVAYGLNANVTYPLLVNDYSLFSPYIGVGLGVNKADKFKFGVNLIGGTYINVGNGSLFVEYTSRRFFDNNLISVGYRFNF